MNASDEAAAERAAFCREAPPDSATAARRNYRRTCTLPCSSQKYLLSSANSGFEVRGAASTHSSRGAVTPPAQSSAFACRADAALRRSTLNELSHDIVTPYLPAAISEI